MQCRAQRRPDIHGERRARVLPLKVGAPGLFVSAPHQAPEADLVAGGQQAVRLTVALVGLPSRTRRWR